MKTNASLWAMDWLMKTGRARRALILSPLSTLTSVWQDDIFDTLPHRTAAVLHGAKARRLKYLGIDADFYILNHDGIKIHDLLAAITDRDQGGGTLAGVGHGAHLATISPDSAASATARPGRAACRA